METEIKTLISAIERRLSQLNYDLPAKFYAIYDLALKENSFESVKVLKRLIIVKKYLDAIR
jgi:hypothetical protein